MLDLHNQPVASQSHALPSGSRLNTLSDNVSTARQVQRQRPAGNSERLLWLMLAAVISEVHRKPGSDIKTATQKAANAAHLDCTP
jgi:hypothetical protein